MAIIPQARAVARKNIRLVIVGDGSSEPTAGPALRFRQEVLIEVIRGYLQKIIQYKMSATTNLKAALGREEATQAALRGAVEDTEDFWEYSDLDWYEAFFPESLQVSQCLAYLRFCEGGGTGHGQKTTAAADGGATKSSS